MTIRQQGKKKSKQKTPTGCRAQAEPRERESWKKEGESRILSQITKFTIEIEEMETKFFFK